MQSFGKLSLERRTQRTVSSVSSTQNGFGINPVLFYSTNINMSEVSLCLELPDNYLMTIVQFHDRHTMSRLIGAPPGYVGFEEGGTNIHINVVNPYSVHRLLPPLRAAY